MLLFSLSWWHFVLGFHLQLISSLCQSYIPVRYRPIKYYTVGRQKWPAPSWSAVDDAVGFVYISAHALYKVNCACVTAAIKLCMVSLWVQKYCRFLHFSSPLRYLNGLLLQHGDVVLLISWACQFTPCKLFSLLLILCGAAVLCLCRVEFLPYKVVGNFPTSPSTCPTSP